MNFIVNHNEMYPFHSEFSQIYKGNFCQALYTHCIDQEKIICGLAFKGFVSLVRIFYKLKYLLIFI